MVTTWRPVLTVRYLTCCRRISNTRITRFCLHRHNPIQGDLPSFQSIRIKGCWDSILPVLFHCAVLESMMWKYGFQKANPNFLEGQPNSRRSNVMLRIRGENQDGNGPGTWSKESLFVQVRAFLGIGLCGFRCIPTVPPCKSVQVISGSVLNGLNNQN